MMTFRYPSEEKIQRFWQWFVENADALYGLAKNDISAALKKIDNRLKSLNRLIVPELNFEPGTDKLELVLSADGIEQVFPAVEAIMEKAPDIENWKFIAFRQPVKLGETLEIDGEIYNPDDFYFSSSSGADGKTDLDIYVKNYNAEEYYRYLSVVFRLINLLLGEYKTVKKIGNVRVMPYQPSGDLKPLRSLPELNL